jgi:hypothetical protein
MQDVSFCNKEVIKFICCVLATDNRASCKYFLKEFNECIDKFNECIDKFK